MKINCTVLKVIKSLYNSIKYGVQDQGKLSGYFSNEIGFLQGKILSPILYSTFIRMIVHVKIYKMLSLKLH